MVVRLLPKLSKFLLPVLLATAASGHEFWIEPGPFRPEPGSILSVRLYVGIRAGERLPFARRSGHAERFELVGPSASKPIVGRDGDDPAGRVRLDEPGWHQVAYASSASRIELEARAFEDYLREEGLEHVLAERARSGASSTSARESYRRCAKSLVRVGEAEGEGPVIHDRVLGLELELVLGGLGPAPSADGSEPATELRARLLLRGRPAPDVQVAAIAIDEPSLRVLARTDERGHVRLSLPRPGPWLLNAVHMRRAVAGEEVDWVSTWASLTLSIPGA